MEFMYEYGLFLVQVITLVLAFAAIVVIVAAASVKTRQRKGQLEITNLSEHYQDVQALMQQQVLDKKAYKKWQKHLSAGDTSVSLPRLFVIDFVGGIDAKEADALREEVSAILAIATPDDEVLVRLESGGGVVHGYGLAASQLNRVTQHKIPLTIAVDKVAASGGYMMACVANKILAAPFAIVGSIGVIAQLPNFNKLLKKHDIDFEQFTAGEYKRTVTLFGENTDKGRDKFQQELEETHHLFKAFVAKQRPQVDLSQVATGEHWFGYQALTLQLVDELTTSDDYLHGAFANRKVLQVRFQLKKRLTERLGAGGASALATFWQRLQNRHWF
ncbi:protease SohB [Alishewanella tabrizica]|uniref:Protease SohB n=1 Tax=Alishewanella tabrizica TaxID=671278 RepID=A0ABQ2WUI8_9ALTE|nr:protease SohB [Alishewanella tabrizica]GGW73220.1 protease SohB [Alishewanella tabrizica]